jgi:hypothetical protein
MATAAAPVPAEKKTPLWLSHRAKPVTMSMWSTRPTKASTISSPANLGQTNWWLTYPSEKSWSEFVSWDQQIPN